MKRLLITFILIFLIGCSVNNTTITEKEAQVSFKGNEILQEGENITFKIYEFLFERTKGNPKEYIDTINGPIGDSIKIIIINGDEYGENRVSSATITLNGVKLFSPKDFNENVDTLEKVVVLTADCNELVTQVAGSPGSFINFTVYYTIELCLFDALPPLSIFDDETGDSIILVDPYYPLVLDEEALNRFFDDEEERLINHNSNTLSFSLADSADIITTGWLSFVNPITHSRKYTITHDGIIVNPKLNDTELRGTIDAHPDHGVDYRSKDSWHSYDWIEIDRVTTNATNRQKVIDYAVEQLPEGYSYTCWTWKYYDYKWCCSSLIWASYYRTGVRDLEYLSPVTSISPMEIVHHPATVRIAYQYN